MRTSRRIIFALILGAAPAAAPGVRLRRRAGQSGYRASGGFAQPGTAAGPEEGGSAGAAPSTHLADLAAICRRRRPSRSRSGNSAGCTPTAMASPRTTCAPSNISAGSPTRMPRTARRRRRRRSSPTPSWRSAATTSTAFPNSKIKSDTDRAREMFSYAASYFGNADAQYDLARLYLKSAGASRDDFRYGARWLGLAAQKGQHQAQAHARPDAVQRRPAAAAGAPAG